MNAKNTKHGFKRVTECSGFSTVAYYQIFCTPVEKALIRCVRIRTIRALYAAPQQYGSFLQGYGMICTRYLSLILNSEITCVSLIALITVITRKKCSES